MTVAAQTPTISYDGDGSSTAFAVPFRYNAPTDLVAIVRDTRGVETVLQYGVDFTATNGSTNAGGTATLTQAPADGTTVVILRVTARVQEADYIETGAFTAESHETALDQAILVSQEQDVELSRALKVPRGEEAPAIDALVLRDNGIAQFVGSRIKGVSLAELAVLLEPEKAAGRTLAYTETVAPSSEVDIFNPDGVDEGGYWSEFAVGADIDFVRAYAKVYAGDGTCDIRVIAGGIVLWSTSGLGSVAVDETVALTVTQGDDLIVTIENIAGAVSGVVVKLEGEAA